MAPAMGFMAVLTHHFLNMIQPNPFPEDLIGNFIDGYEDALSDPDTIRALLWYELGFLVCAVIGILYMVLMPVIGGILACCRCSGECGGRMLQRQTSRTNTYRKALYWSVFMTTGIVLLGNIYMFITCNAAFTVGVDQIQGTLDDLHAYFTAVPEQSDHMMNEYSKVVDEINTIGPKLGEAIQKSFELGVRPALELVGTMTNLSHVFDTNLSHLSSTLVNIDVYCLIGKNTFRGFIVDAIKSINNATREADCTDECKDLLKGYEKQLRLEIKDLFDFNNFSQSLSIFQTAVNAVKWDSLLWVGNDYLTNISENVTRDTEGKVKDMENNLEVIKLQISNITSDFLTSVSTNVTDTLQQLQRNISTITPVVERVEHITRAIGVVLCCMVLLVVVCNVLGLFLGPLGLEPKADPINRSSTAHCGGDLLMMSSGFIFLFSWLLMGVVLLLFVLGGNMYALVCKPWHDGELLKHIDTPRLIGFELDSMLGLKSNLTLTDVYSNCQKNMSLWSTLHMNEIINLEEQLNVSQYTDEILDNVNISPIMLLSHVEKEIITLLNETQNINFTRLTQQINKSTNLTTILTNMQSSIIDIMDMFPDTSEVSMHLRGVPNNLQFANVNFKKYITKPLYELNSTTEKSNVHEFNGTVSKVFRKVGEAQDILNNYTTTQIKTKNRDFVDSQLGNIIVTYAEWANLTQHVARCGPVARAVDSVKNIICENMLESLNTFWFSLGWCLIFFIPSIIFSIKLAKYYRRMEESDRYYKRMEEANRYDRRMNESDRAVESSVRHASSQNL